MILHSNAHGPEEACKAAKDTSGSRGEKLRMSPGTRACVRESAFHVSERPCGFERVLSLRVSCSARSKHATRSTSGLLLSPRSSLPSPQGIHDLQADEVFFVIRNQDAIIGYSHRGDDHVEGTPRPPGRGPVSHQARPDKAGLLIEREHAAGEQRLGTLGA